MRGFRIADGKDARPLPTSVNEKRKPPPESEQPSPKRQRIRAPQSKQNRTWTTALTSGLVKLLQEVEAVAERRAYACEGHTNAARGVAGALVRSCEGLEVLLGPDTLEALTATLRISAGATPAALDDFTLEDARYRTVNAAAEAADGDSSRVLATNKEWQEKQFRAKGTAGAHAYDAWCADTSSGGGGRPVDAAAMQHGAVWRAAALGPTALGPEQACAAHALPFGGDMLATEACVTFSAFVDDWLAGGGQAFQLDAARARDALEVGSSPAHILRAMLTWAVVSRTYAQTTMRGLAAMVVAATVGCVESHHDRARACAALLSLRCERKPVPTVAEMLAHFGEDVLQLVQLSVPGGWVAGEHPPGRELRASECVAVPFVDFLEANTAHALGWELRRVVSWRGAALVPTTSAASVALLSLLAARDLERRILAAVEAARDVVAYHAVAATVPPSVDPTSGGEVMTAARAAVSVCAEANASARMCTALAFLGVEVNSCRRYLMAAAGRTEGVRYAGSASARVALEPWGRSTVSHAAPRGTYAPAGDVYPWTKLEREASVAFVRDAQLSDAAAAHAVMNVRRGGAPCAVGILLAALGEGQPRAYPHKSRQVHTHILLSEGWSPDEAAGMNDLMFRRSHAAAEKPVYALSKGKRYGVGTECAAVCAGPSRCPFTGQTEEMRRTVVRHMLPNASVVDVEDLVVAPARARGEAVDAREEAVSRYSQCKRLFAAVHPGVPVPRRMLPAAWAMPVEWVGRGENAL